MPNLYDKLESEGLKDMIMENFYNYSIFSLCCNEHIPIDVAVRVFEVIIFEGLGDVSLVRRSPPLIQSNFFIRQISTVQIS